MNNIKIINQQCNYSTNTLGLDSLPYFSWNYTGALNGFIQESFQIIVLNSDSKLVWDSGVIKSDNFTNIKYTGETLLPRTKYSWYVSINPNGSSPIKSSLAFFETGKLDEKWLGNWITAGNKQRPDQYTYSPYLRKTFTLNEEIKQARLYITGLGYFEAYINGQKTSSDILSPAFTNYDKTVLYTTYDVTSLLNSGQNVLGTILGNGWYNCFTKDVWNIREVSWRHLPKLLAELRIITQSGKEIVIKTDTSWKSTNSPITFNSIRNGEYYNANLEIENWCDISCNDDSWDDVKLIRAPGGNIISSELEPIRITKTIKPIKFWKTTKESWIFDMGQNMSGFVKLYAEGKKEDETTIIYNEKLLDDGINLFRRANAGFTRSGEFQTDKYIKKSDALEIWSPKFVYHGFRYIELVGLTYEPNINSVEGLVVHSDIKRMGSLETSDEIINKIIEISHWSTIGNLHGLLTDSPHREKNSWTGDASISAEQTMFNYLPINIFKKWLNDIKDSQKPSGCIPCVIPSTGWGYNWGNGPDWSSALTLIPWYLYTYYNDIEIIETMYDTIKSHFGYMESMADNYIVNYGIGDWCAPFKGEALSVNMSSFKAPTELTDTAYFYNTADVISKMAKVLHKESDVTYYKEISQKIKKAFREKYFNEKDTSVYGDCQTSTGCMLYQGLATKNDENNLIDLLKKQIIETNYHLDFGILGNKYVMNTLGVSNNFDLGIKMITQKTFPSFGDIITQGATTLWETWNGKGSHNHHMFSDVVASLYKYLGGIRADYNIPGFKHIIMQPSVDCGIESVSCSFNSIRGPISSNWSNKKGELTMDIEIPYGCSATLILPKKYIGLFNEYEIKKESDFFSVSLLAGNHKIRS